MFASKPVSDEIILVINWIDDISKEKNASGILLLIAILLAIESDNAVLPIPGLAAIITRSLSCQPAVSLSILLNPDATPLKPSLFETDSILFLAWITRL